MKQVAILVVCAFIVANAFPAQYNNDPSGIIPETSFLEHNEDEGERPCKDECPQKCHTCGEPCSVHGPQSDQCHTCVDNNGCHECFDCMSSHMTDEIEHGGDGEHGSDHMHHPCDHIPPTEVFPNGEKCCALQSREDQDVCMSAGGTMEDEVFGGGSGEGPTHMPPTACGGDTGTQCENDCGGAKCKYCDDHGCCTSDAEGSFCKEQAEKFHDAMMGGGKGKGKHKGKVALVQQKVGVKHYPMGSGAGFGTHHYYDPGMMGGAGGSADHYPDTMGGAGYNGGSDHYDAAMMGGAGGSADHYDPAMMGGSGHYGGTLHWEVHMSSSDPCAASCPQTCEDKCHAACNEDGGSDACLKCASDNGCEDCFHCMLEHHEDGQGEGEVTSLEHHQGEGEEQHEGEEHHHSEEGDDEDGDHEGEEQHEEDEHHA